MKYTFIDLFAGIGGIRLGFEQACNDLSCVFTSEIDKFSCLTYNANFNNDIIFGDITKVENKDIPKHDILLAGFPCQAFSVAGQRKGFDDARGTLFFEIARIVEYHKPQVLFLENVKGLINHDKGNTFKTILSILEQLEYKVYYKVLNTKDFGLPQNRERIYIVCFKNKNIQFEFPLPFPLEVKVKYILETTVDNKYTLSNKMWQWHQIRKAKHKEKGTGFGYSLCDEKSYTRTLSARYYKDGNEILIPQENLNPRKLTPRECARLQGFPDSFKIVVSDTQAYKQFGNSVSVPIIKYIAKNIFKSLNNML